MIGDRHVIGRHIEHSIMEYAPETVLVHVKADADVIVRRMKEAPHAHPVVQEKDVEMILERFADENWNSLLGNRIVLDTSKASVEETVEEFAEKITPFLTEWDMQRMLLHQLKR